MISKLRKEVLRWGGTTRADKSVFLYKFMVSGYSLYGDSVRSQYKDLSNTAVQGKALDTKAPATQTTGSILHGHGISWVLETQSDCHD